MTTPPASPFQKLKTFLVKNLVGGIAFLLPVVVLVVIVDKAIEILGRVTKPVLRFFPDAQIFHGLGLLTILEIGLFALVCVFAGWLSTTEKGIRFYRWIEQSVLYYIPGYPMVRGFIRDFTGKHDETNLEVVLACIEDDAWQWALLVERLENGRVAVFVPGSPSPMSGSLYYVSEDRIKPTQIPSNRVFSILRRYGMGSRATLKDVF